ncbi:lytic polysaccharide monooxygenase [Actinomadura sp. NEAU-AAG7]|uniref:lytic polysaccharide monooxygenase auxiliary activity family 9 protein n=1 Tax=Actinomadura sp. NEAU-AAG7 TaxID=2839640 RepID=UPI001BE40D11|nr:lytic polysaccharide monooxygenase auxiliary activity family 9 protein [Actinomadura sp. NEAU-AAG7]MBT2210968.1 lytic polysaccharide monooxygenase [Actinomadura sp. NEAU-AAG7]
MPSRLRPPRRLPSSRRLPTPRARTLVLAAAASAGLTVVVAAPAFSHGYTNTPVSRALFCKQGTVKDCGEVKYEPQSVEGPKGFPKSGPRDGTICAAGDSRWAPLDDPRGGQWPATSLTGGQSYTFAWTLTAAHSTASFRYFVTKDGWDYKRPVTRAALDLTPFLRLDYGNKQPPRDFSHSGTLPVRHGRHLIVAVWDIADTGNAFYQCSDVDFG